VHLKSVTPVNLFLYSENINLERNITVLTGQ